MPRPKGSKNKNTVEDTQQETVAVEFDYERDDVRFDTAYNPLSVTGSSTYASDVFVSPEETFTVDPRSVPSDTGLNSSSERKLYLVEGEVQLTPRVPGRAAVVAKQFRLVWGKTDEEAIMKFANYFRGLSDAESAYTVVSAAAMETIH